jgi:pimeloyl-ACP methyl ester carboxylesterase
MKVRVVVVIALAALAIVAVIGVGGMLRFRPLTVFRWQTRAALRTAGLHKRTVPAPPGPQTAFVGGQGPVVVLLHGAGDNAGTWHRIVPELTARYSLLVPDLAGHGDSAPQAGPIAVPDILAGAEAVIDTLAPGRKVALVGNSLGGWIAMLLAHRHPERIALVVCVNGGAVTGDNAHALILPKNRAEARAAVAQVRDPGSVPIPDFVLDDIVREAQHGALARFAATAPSMQAWTLDGRLGEIGVPVQLIWGTSDRLIPLAYAERMKAELPHAGLATLEHCGHVPQLECTQPFTAALTSALASVSW